jgi:hypothetical protein
MNWSERVDEKLEKWREKPATKSLLNAWGRLYDGPTGFILFQIFAIPLIICISVVERLGNFWWSYVLAVVIAMVMLAIVLSVWSRIIRKGNYNYDE